MVDDRALRALVVELRRCAVTLKKATEAFLAEEPEVYAPREHQPQTSAPDRPRLPVNR